LHDSPAGVTVSLAASMAYGGDATGDRLIEIEGLVGSAFADSLTGDRLTNDLQGGGGEGTDQVRSVETFVFADGAVVPRLMYRRQRLCPSASP
jgi:hypothetical protein